MERCTKEELAKWWHAQCPKCGWDGLSRDCAGGEPIADTGDFNDPLCPMCIKKDDCVVVDDYVEPDAQATIAALQARVQELEQWVQDQSTANLETMRHVDEMQSRAMDAESQLTRRTAELEATKRERDHAKKMEVVQKEVADNQTWHVQQLRAELERVRAERDRLALCGHDHSTQWWQVRYEDLASLVAALPKEPYSLEFARHTSFYEPLQALTQHRQGMEG